MVDGDSGKPRRRWVVRGLWVIAAGVLGAVPAANVALMVPAVKSKVEAKLSAVAGSRVKAGSIRYWPWSGVTMRSVEVAEGGRMPGVVVVDEVLVDVGLSSVFSDDIEVPLVRVVRPVIDVEWKKIEPVVVAAVGNADTRPALEEVPPGRSEPVEPVAPVAQAEVVGTAGEPGEKTVATPAVARRRQLLLGKVEVVEGVVVVKLAGIEGEVVRAAGIGLEADFSEKGDGEGGDGVIGRLVVGEIEAGGRLRVEDVEGEVVIDGSAIRIRGVEAEIGGGVLGAGGAVVLGAGGLPFEVEVEATGIEIGQLFGEGFEGFQLSGVLDGQAKVAGYGTVPESWRGKGGFRIAELGVSGGGTAVVLEPTEVSGTLQGGWFNLERFYAHSDELALRASGGALMDGRLALNLRVYVDRAVATVVARKLEVLGGGRSSDMRELEGTHYAFRDVAVRGTVSDPMLVLWNDQTAVRAGEFLRCFTPEGVPVEPFLAQ